MSDEVKTVEPVQEPEKVFKQEDVNNMIAKERASATEKLLKELGVTDAKSAKEGLAKFKEMQDAQRTEAEKLTESLKETQARITESETRAAMAEAKLAAISSGVPADKADKVVKLAATYEGASMAEKIAAVIAEFPELKGQPTPPSLGAKTNNDNLTDIDKARAEIRKSMGLA